MNSWFRADRFRGGRTPSGPGMGGESGGNRAPSDHVEADVHAQLNATPAPGYPLPVLPVPPEPLPPEPLVTEPLVTEPLVTEPLVTESGQGVDVAAERRAAVWLCLYALDRARSAGVVERLVGGLAELGVRALRPDGERFDPSRHEAGGTVPTDDPALDGVVAETEVIGFADRGDVLRVPIVTVYTSRGGAR